MNEDFRDMLAALLEAGARFMVVGAYAMAVHGVPRAMGDLAIWVSPEPGNAERAWAALLRFGAPVRSIGVSREDLAIPGTVIQIGVAPRRIDLLTEISGVDFEAAWASRVTHAVGSLQAPFLGRGALVENKRAARATEGPRRP